ncbi:MAG: cytochrome c biogenesis protein CcdA [Pseudomonadota bacterium]
MELVFGYLAGLLTLINPCVLPILPIVLAGSLQSNRYGPVIFAAGMSLAFVVLGVLVSTLGYSLGLTGELVADIGAVLMILFGSILLVPRLSAGFATATAGLGVRADAGFDGVDETQAKGQFVGGMLMGAVWSPCIGPTLGGAIALASQGQSLVWATAIMISFALGVSTVILALAYGTRHALARRRDLLRRLALRSRPILGAAFLIVGIGILFRWHHALEFWALENLPTWLTDLSVAL